MSGRILLHAYIYRLLYFYSAKKVYILI